jgi:membrane peptidoglycan carboxypeptidase
MAFERGFPDTTVLFDLPTEFNPNCDASATQVRASSPCYHPRNYLGTFSGPVTMRQALARSLNVPSVKTLYLAGIKNTAELATSMGVSSLDTDDYYGLSLGLGGAGVSLHDMVAGYSVFANDGVRAPSTFILKITSSDGGILEEYTQKSERILSTQTARMISDILSDNNARSAVFGFNSSLYIPGRQVAAKTGTTQNNRDGWLIGYTPSIVAGVWTGNNDDKPMTSAGAGSSAAGPLWKEFMTQALKDSQNKSFIKPAPMISGKAMLNGSFGDINGEIHSVLHYVNTDDVLGPWPQNPFTDPQYKNWESSVRSWVLSTQTFSPTASTSEQQ